MSPTDPRTVTTARGPYGRPTVTALDLTSAERPPGSRLIHLARDGRHPSPAPAVNRAYTITRLLADGPMSDEHSHQGFRGSGLRYPSRG